MQEPAHPFRTDAPIWLSNGAYGSLLTAAGTGFSLYGDHLLTNWQDDCCEDDLGFTIALRDAADGKLWTASGAVLPGGDRGTLTALPEGAVLERRSRTLQARVELEVLAESPVERRRLTLTNEGRRATEIEITGFLEVVLHDPAAHAAHPAFSKLFVQTRRHAAEALLLATRRPRANGETHPTMALAMVGAPAFDWETDRARFRGRGRRLAAARGLRAPLSRTVGNVLDPMLALRTTVHLGAGESVSLLFLIAAAADEATILAQLRAAPDAVALAPAHVIDAAAARLEEGTKSLADAPLWRRLSAMRLAAATPAASTVATARPAPSPRPSPPPPQPSAPPLPRSGSAVAFGSSNGHGQFSPDGQEYQMQLRREADGCLRLPPMPWTNVIANERFGLIASEKGSLSTFAGNSRLHRLTPWSNDPLIDPHDEAFYVRDAATGEYWSLLPGPRPAAHHYEVAHGFGYSRWQHRHADLDSEVTVFVPCADPLRIADIRIRNTGSTARRVALYAYNRWVLGATPASSFGQLQVEFDAARRAVLARNPEAGVFSSSLAFATFAGIEADVDACIDRAHFLGSPGSVAAPAALDAGGPLCADQGVDACAALRIEVGIEPGAEVRLAALLGAAESLDEIDVLRERYHSAAAVADAYRAVRDFWSATHARMQIATPVPAIDLMVNGWLGYQTIACRLWARSACYQSGGAFGFRDQLQDAAALALTQPQFLREQLLRNAAHQFPEGDVLHWWHPPTGVGVRTRFADDLVWLPYLTAHYVAVTGDRAILHEQLPFVTGAALAADEDERYFLPARDEQTQNLYSHCVRALERAMTCGAHGLPLFGGGDWNDGMNRVGHAGRGESVWMGFFLFQTLGDFLPLCADFGDETRAARFAAYRADLERHLNDEGWDGEWYRRAFYDNGHALGSATSDECRIDALAQAWAVMTGIASPERAAAALDALERHLISDRDGLIRLLTPPFENTAEDPGYIKGYVAGVRENGGQYTHAALWVVRAMAEAGRRTRAAQLLEMLSPVTHTADAERVARYQAEPYVIAADVYGAAPHVGRGGWTWYTGSAGWMLRVTIESLLGFGIEAGEWLTLTPRIPDEWPGFRLTHRRPDGTQYQIEVDNPQRVAGRVRAAWLDGAPLLIGATGLRVALAHDQRLHLLRVTLGPEGEPWPR
jgi:cyclic beta-1,2-glucan synthetase